MNKHNFETLQRSIISWGEAKGLTAPEAATKQTLKMFAEAGELADAVLKDTNIDDEDYIADEDILDGIGDVLVTLILLAEIKGTTFEECLNVAYAEIAGRKGVTLDGVFIKESDPRYACAVAMLDGRNEA